AVPLRRDFFRELARARVFGAAHEIGIAEPADGARAIFLAAGPQITAGKSEEDRGPAGIRPFTLECVVDLVDGVAHTNASANPFARSRHASQWPHGSPLPLGS